LRFLSALYYTSHCSLSRWGERITKLCHLSVPLGSINSEPEVVETSNLVEIYSLVRSTGISIFGQVIRRLNFRIDAVLFYVIEHDELRHVQ